MGEYQRCLELFYKMEKPRFDQFVGELINNFINSIKEQREDFPQKIGKIAALVTIIDFIPPEQYCIILNALSPLMKSDFFIHFKSDKTGK